MIVDVNLKFHEHVASVARKASGLCLSFLKSTVDCLSHTEFHVSIKKLILERLSN